MTGDILQALFEENAKLRLELSEARTKAMEDAARVADKFANERWTSDRAFYGKEVCIELAEAIRALTGSVKE